MSAHKN